MTSKNPNLTLKLSDAAYQKATDVIFITGSARSGTTILGKLLATLESVEYFFEPPALFTLLAQLEHFSKPNASSLFASYVVEEMLVGALTGRSVNIRRQDDSCIYHAKTEAEINRRLLSSARKSELNFRAARIAIKIPDFVYKINTITSMLSVKNLVVTIRKPETTISSLLRRGWFTDDSLMTKTIMWPNYDIGPIPVPHWVPTAWHEDWACLTPLERSSLYYIVQTDFSSLLLEKPVVVDYDNFLGNPKVTQEAIANRFNLKVGEKTSQILRTIANQDSTGCADLRNLRSDLKDAVLKAYESVLPLAVTGQ